MFSDRSWQDQAAFQCDDDDDVYFLQGQHA